MNKKFASLILGLSISITTAALAAEQDAAPVPAPDSGPKIVFLTNVYNFGKIKAGDPVKYTFIFTNVGKELLILTNVQPSCGCTTAGEWSHQVEPGQTGTIPIQFNSGNYNGAVTKTVTVTCNDKTTPTIGLQVTGTIWKPIDVNPQFAVMNIPAEGQDTVKTAVKIVNNMEEPLEVFTPESNNKAFSAELKTNQPGKEFEVTISANGPFETPNVQAQISLKTSATNSPTLSITAWANVQQLIVLSPPQITLPAGPLPGKQVVNVTIQNNGTNALTLSEPMVDAKGVDVSVGEPTPGKTFTATLTFPEGFEAPQGAQPQFTVKTSHPRNPLLKVPIMQLPRPVAAPPIPAPTLQPAAVPVTPGAPQAAAAAGNQPPSPPKPQ